MELMLKQKIGKDRDIKKMRRKKIKKGKLSNVKNNLLLNNINNTKL